LIIGDIRIMDENDVAEFRPILRLIFQARSVPLVSLTLRVFVYVDYVLCNLRKVPWNTLWETLEHFSQLERISIGLSLLVSDLPYVRDEIQEQQMEAVVRDGCSGWINRKLFVHFNMEI
jgi:hypothetical protein